MTADDLLRPDVLGFRCGEEPWEDKVAEQFRSGRVWTERKERTTKTYLYCTDAGEGDLLGFATVGKKSIRTIEADGSPGQIRTMLIAWFAVATAYQGARPEGRHADIMVTELAAIAIDQELEGFTAFVDERNVRAMRFWTRLGFVPVDGYPPNVEPDGSRNILLVFPFPKKFV